MVAVVYLRRGVAVPAGIEHISVRPVGRNRFELFAALAGEEGEFQVTATTFDTVEHALGAAQSFALSMHVEQIFVVRDPVRS